jgi:DNA-binding response OmpR family regulator
VARVLVVEDEESFSDALSYMLRKEGFEVAVAETGTHALTEFDRNGADIVLLDLDAAGDVGHRGVPAAAAEVGGSDHHGDRAGQ